MNWLIGFGVGWLIVAIVRIVRTAPDESELWRTPLDPRERAMSTEQVEIMRRNGGM